jgi:RNA polymerase sigma-70 factor, ECF subfamily
MQGIRHLFSSFAPPGRLRWHFGLSRRHNLSKKSPCVRQSSPHGFHPVLRSPVPAPNEWSLERYRPLLRLQARQLELDQRLKRLWDSSDIVQDAFCGAIAKLDQFRGTSEGELVRWLQRILANTVKDKIDAARADKRDIGLVQSLEQAVADSSVRLDAFVAAEQSSPSEQAECGEMLLRLAAALDKLPEEQRDVIIHHHLHATPVAEVAERMGKTPKAVAMLLYRGKRRLHELLATEENR